jgi:2,4-dienoyl-CoA reductase-like NADH-dependent reductase (Old Yellow Enzyme family)
MNTQPNVFTPAKLGPVTLRNRTIKAATFEASTPHALVTDDLITYHRLPAAGGVGMTTVAYLAVSPGGRTEGKQIWWRQEAIPGLHKLTAAIHAEGAAISAQIGHAGPVADSRSNRAKALAPVRFFNPIAMRFAKKATRDDITEVIAAHANAARFAIESGFDAVEIHLGHNYFASSFLSPLINRRDDEFGGSLENRAKVARGMVMAVRRAVKDQIAVTAAMAEGFDFVAMGRALLAEPDLINRIQANGDQHSVLSKCTHCNQCMATIYSHTHCVVTGSPG